jgi:hypothetical protein
MAQPVLARLLRLVGVRPLVRGGERPGLRVNAYANRERLVVHLVNFRVPKTGEPVHQRDVVLHVPVPHSCDGRKLRGGWYVPGNAPRELPATERAGHAEVTVPDLRTYGVLELELGTHAPETAPLW